MYHFEKKDHLGDISYERKEEEHIIIKGHKIRIQIIFTWEAICIYIHDDKVKWTLNGINIKEKNPQTVLNHFCNSSRFKKFLKMVKQNIEEMSKPYGGFPSESNQINIMKIEFTNERTISVWYRKEYSSIEKEYQINADLLCGMSTFLGGEKRMHVSIRHELYHIIADVHEGEEEQAEALKKWESAISEKLISNKEYITKHILEFEKEVKLGFDLQSVTELEVFWGQETRVFWNTIIDTALQFIALNYSDIKYISSHVRYLNHYKLRHPIKKIRREIKKLKSDKKLDENKKKIYIRLLIVLEYISAYMCMPYEKLPCAISKHYLFKEKHKKVQERAKNDIKKFEKHIENNLEPDAQEAFFKVWAQYKIVVSKMDVIVDSLNPQIREKVHNAQSMNEAKECYKTLNREFYGLFKKVKESTLER